MIGSELAKKHSINGIVYMYQKERFDQKDTRDRARVKSNSYKTKACLWDGLLRNTAVKLLTAN